MTTTPPKPAPTGFLGVIARYRSLVLPVALIAMLAVIIVPMPPWAMDAMIVLNFGMSVMVLMATINLREPLDFSVFPSLLLAVTLFRLVLNIASTRLILSADAGSPEEAKAVAGGVIEAFGSFVAGESLVVGIILFLILIVVQFVVITKGATRISEVAARFTLDAMPGKQLAIDADLNAGIINEAEARRRRERISREADFFGAMDGASKFVRGDAIAGIIITVINVVGGILIGVVQKGWPIGQTTETFTILTIGDGLTSQLPAFIISIAAALIVTRSGSKEQLGEEFATQITSQPTGLMITGGFLLSLVATPLPTLPLLVGAVILFVMAWVQTSGSRTQKRLDKAGGPAAAPVKAEPPSPESLLKLDTMELEVGYGLVSLVDTNQGGDLLERIAAIRRQLAVELGFILPPVRIRDNLQLPATDYRLKIKGNAVARGTVQPGRLLAIDSGITTGPIDGLPGREPAFGLDAWWIEPALRSQAEAMNYTVAEPTSVIATHLTEVVRTGAADLLTREEVAELLAQLKQRAPKLVEDVIPSVVKTGELHRILQNLLRERVPIRDLETVLETLADWAGKTKDLDVLTEYARNALRRTISAMHAVADNDPATGAARGAMKIVCATVDPDLDDLINNHIDRSPAGTTITLPVAMANRVTSQLVRGCQALTAAGHQPILLASPRIRAVVRQLVEQQVPTAVVLGYNEIASGYEIESVALITPPGSQTAGQATAAA